jgi:hypothetical protein
MRDPLWQLQQAVYTRLDTDLTATVYDWLPNPPSYPYVLMEGEGSEPYAETKSAVLARCSVTLLAVSTSKGGQEIKELVDALVTSMETRLTLADSWTVIRQQARPNTTAFRATMNDGLEGRAARIVYTFDIKDTE